MSVTQNSTSSPVATRLASTTHPTRPSPNSENVKRVEHVGLRRAGLWAQLRLRGWLWLGVQTALSAMLPPESSENVEWEGLQVRRWS